MADQTTTVVRERDTRRLRAMFGVLSLTALVVMGVLGYVSLRLHAIRVSYELEDLRSLRDDVAEQNRKLRLETASLRSFGRVDSAARRLGFTEPARDQVRLAREFAAPDVAVLESPAGPAVRTAARIEGPAARSGRP